MKDGDKFNLHLKHPTDKETTVTVVTGGPASKNGDKLEHGVLEVSSNGKEWTKIGDFEDGKAVGKAAAGASQIRLRVTGPQTNWLIVREIEIK